MEAVLVIQPQRCRVAFAVERCEVVRDFLAVNVPDEGPASRREALALQNVGVEPKLDGVVQLG
jgi:hypothetical protein